MKEISMLVRKDSIEVGCVFVNEKKQERITIIQCGDKVALKKMKV